MAQTVRMTEAVAGDIQYHDGMADAIGLSEDCKRFITKVMEAKPEKVGRGRVYEIQATDDELLAVINEVLVPFVEDLWSVADEQWGKDRQDYLRQIRKLQAFMDKYSEDGE